MLVRVCSRGLVLNAYMHSSAPCVCVQRSLDVYLTVSKSAMVFFVSRARIDHSCMLEKKCKYMNVGRRIKNVVRVSS